MMFLYLGFAPKIHTESWGAKLWQKKEANFDLYIHDLLVEAGVQADTQGSNIVPINEALKTASKHQTGKVGFPEYTAAVGDFVLVMEDKADRANLCLKEADGTISMTVQATTDYAVNGALHYAQHILQKTTYKKFLRTCIFSDDVKRFALREHNGNEYVYLFMKTVILQQKKQVCLRL